MADLTSEDREEIQRQITEYKSSNPVVVAPSTPTGVDAEEALHNALEEGANPDKREVRRVRKRIRGMWRSWRSVTLDAKSLEIEKIACQIAVERAQAQAKINEINRANEIAEAQHWLALNKGNLQDIDANTESRPHPVWYGLRRFCHHMTKLTDNFPKVFKNLLWISVFIIGLIILKRFNVL